jgi:hypothetical protein
MLQYNIIFNLNDSDILKYFQFSLVLAASEDGQLKPTLVGLYDYSITKNWYPWWQFHNLSFSLIFYITSVRCETGKLPISSHDNAEFDADWVSADNIGYGVT